MQAETEAYITQKQADQQYLATLDRYAKFANLLKKAQSEMGFDSNQVYYNTERTGNG